MQSVFQQFVVFSVYNILSGIGPGMFLRGPGGLQSANDAIEAMDSKSESTIMFFMAGLGGIIISSILQAFLLYTILNACLISVGLLLVAYLLTIYARQVIEKLYVTKGTEITGKIEGNMVADPTNIQFNK